MQVHARVAHGHSQVFAPFLVGLLVAVAGLNAAAQQIAHRFERGIGVDQVHETLAAGAAGIRVKAAEHHQIVFVGNLGKLRVDL